MAGSHEASWMQPNNPEVQARAEEHVGYDPSIAEISTGRIITANGNNLNPDFNQGVPLGPWVKPGTASEYTGYGSKLSQVDADAVAEDWVKSRRIYDNAYPGQPVGEAADAVARLEKSMEDRVASGSKKPTLAQLDKANTDLRAEYRANYHAKSSAEQSAASPPVVESSRLLFESKTKHQARIKAAIGAAAAYNQKILERTTAIEDKNLAKAEALAQENAGDLHDLALMQAHLEGVSVKTENPILVGEEVSAETPEQHSVQK